MIRSGPGRAPTALLVRRCSAIVTIGALALVQGCASLAPPRRPPLRPGSRAHLSATGDPLFVRWTPTDSAATLADCRATRVAGDVTAHSGDTIRFSVLTEVEPATAGDPACAARSSALVITAPDDARRLEVERFSPVRSIVGFVALTAGVGVTILLLASAADGLIDAVGRWF